jgi:hypothetical protein
MSLIETYLANAQAQAQAQAQHDAAAAKPLPNRTAWRLYIQIEG